MPVSQSISTLLNGVRQAYIDDQKAKDIKSSGKSAESLRPEVTENSGTLYGAKYFYQQKNGRRPGKFPPISDILDWIRQKGITPRDAKTSERSLAFLFARKIAEKGTDIFEGKRPALDVEEKVKVLVEDFKKSLTNDIRVEITQQIKSALK